MANQTSIVLDNWVEENKDRFVPPVCNKLMYGVPEGELKVMFVGGPNQRKDFHIEEGEELFFMIKGYMQLPIIEKGKKKLVQINEGEVFLLPRMIPHSPQRFENSLGLVIESDRNPENLDCLRYYVEDSDEVLWEEWFHCTNLEALKAIIDKASEQFATGKPVPGFIKPPPRAIDEITEVTPPFSLAEYLSKNSDNFTENGLTICKSNQTSFIAFSKGSYAFPSSTHERLIWQYKGSAELVLETGEKKSIPENGFFLIPVGIPSSLQLFIRGCILKTTN